MESFGSLNPFTNYLSITYMQNSVIYGVLLLFTLMMVPFQSVAARQQDRDITITLPAETVLATIQKLLPLPFQPKSENMQGQIVLQSLDMLEIHDNTLSMHGTLSGKDLAMTTNIAGQDIKLKLGQVQLPMSCDMKLRYDRPNKILYITPFFPPPKQADKNEAALAPLLAALGGKEFPIVLDELQSLQAEVGGQSIPILMEPTKITGADNALLLEFQPQVTTVQ